MSPLFDRPPIDAISVSNSLFSSGTFRITGGPGVTVGSDASGASISAKTAAEGSFFENAVQMGSVQQGLAVASVDTNLAGGRLLVQPITPAAELFPFNISATRMLLNFSGGATTSSSNLSAAFSSTFFVGFYTRVNSTQLSLVNSVSKSTAAGASTANYSRFVGPRWLTFHSSAFSSAPTFLEGSRYWFAQLIRTSGAIYTSNSFLQQFGQYHQLSVQRSGSLGEAVGSATSLGWYPFMGLHSLTTHTALPVTLAHSQINKASSLANFIPHLALDAGLGALD
jgi:hypothetical protein